MKGLVLHGPIAEGLSWLAQYEGSDGGAGVARVIVYSFRYGLLTDSRM